MACSSGCKCRKHSRPKRTPEERRRGHNEAEHRRRARMGPEGLKAARLRTHFGWSLDAYRQTLATQNGVCAICQADTPGGRGDWHVDHDHACCPTKRACGQCIRGLLCHRCNILLGMAGDSVRVLTRAIEYLKDSKCSVTAISDAAAVRAA